MTTPKAGWSTPALHVKDIARSIKFYALLGFELLDYEGDPTSPGWARMRCEGGDIMFLCAEVEIEPRKQGFFIYMYTDELPALREHLLANGVKVSAINRPPYMQTGEIAVPDPDGYHVFVGQWDSATHQKWERERRERLQRLVPRT